MSKSQVPCSLRALLLAALAAAAPAAVRAQTQPQGLEDLGNAVQKPIAQALVSVCQQFNSVGAQGQGQLDLYARCADLVDTANLILGSGQLAAGGVLAATISGIDTVEQLEGALQQLGTEEFSAEDTNATETSRGRVLLKRMAARRGGTAGIAVAGLDLGLDGRFVDAETLVAALGAARDTGTGVPARQDANLAPAAGSSGGGSEGSLFGSERWGLFANGVFGFGSRDGSAREDGFDFNVPGLTVGADYRSGTRWIVGGALGWESFDADYDTTPGGTVSGGSLQSDLLTLSLYASRFGERFYVDGIASFGRSDYEMARRVVYPSVDVSASGDTDGSQTELTAAVGYTGSRRTFQYSPSLRLSKLSVDIDGYVERGDMGVALEVRDQQVDSLVSIAGSQFSWSLSRGGGVLLPQLRAEWHHEFDNDSRPLTAKFAADPFGVLFTIPTDDPDEDYFSVGGGLSSVGRGGRQAFIDFEALLGLEDVTNYVVTGGIRFAL